MAERLSTGMVNAINVTGSVKAIMDGGEIRFFTGTQPADADLIETGDHILTLTKDGLSHTPGGTTNGLTLATTSVDGYVTKTLADVWSGIGLAAAGTTGKQAGWFRWYDKNVTTGESTTACRMDGSLGTSSSFEGTMSNLVIVENAPCTVNTFRYRTRKA